MKTQEDTSKLYLGIAPVRVITVNPGKDLSEALFNTNLESEPKYLSKREINGNTIPCVRIDFIVKTDPEKTDGIELISKVSFFLSKQYCTTKDGGKVKVIDKYGRTAWVTLEEFSSHSIPLYKNGPAHIDKDYRGCYLGEEEMTFFLKVLLGIPNVVDKKSDGLWTPEDDDEAAYCEARLSNINKLFIGDFKDLNEIISYSPQSRIKVMFGVRTAEDGKKYQTSYTHKFLRLSSDDYSRLADDLANRRSRGAYKNTEFSTDALHELDDPNYRQNRFI